MVGQDLSIHRTRLEEIEDLQADVVTARACAPLAQLLTYAERFLRPDSICVFPKGGRVDEELTEAGKTWRMTLERFPSLSDSTGTILRIRQVARAGL
jgi:16S rRNA (guanine527-N7)-methyltransferase